MVNSKLPGCKSWLCHSQAEVSLCLSFLHISKIGLMTVSLKYVNICKIPQAMPDMHVANTLQVFIITIILFLIQLSIKITRFYHV